MWTNTGSGAPTPHPHGRLDQGRYQTTAPTATPPRPRPRPRPRRHPPWTTSKRARVSEQERERLCVCVCERERTTAQQCFPGKPRPPLSRSQSNIRQKTRKNMSCATPSSRLCVPRRDSTNDMPNVENVGHVLCDCYGYVRRLRRGEAGKAGPCENR